MKQKIIAVFILATIVALALLSVLPIAAVLGIFAVVAFFALIGVLLYMSINAWAELEKKDPEKARKMWFDAICELESRRSQLLPGF